MRPTVKTDIRNFGDMVRDVVRRQGRTVRAVVDSEGAAILGTMVRRSKAAQVQAIYAAEAQRLFRTVDSRRYFLLNRYPDALWTRLEALRQASLQRRLGARGLLKLSWAQIALALGLVVALPAYVRRATGARGQPRMGKGARAGDNSKYVLTLENASAVARVTAGARLLNTVVRGRVRQYRRGIDEAFKKLAAQAGAGRGTTVR